MEKARLAHLPGAHQAQLAATEIHQRSLQGSRGTRAYVVWRFGRTRAATSRIVHLRKARAAIRFLSIEPLIAPVGKLSLDNIHWVIVGGESGPGARPMKPEWAIDIRNQCVAARVPFFFKQWGGRSPKTGGRKLEGKVWSQFPKRGAALAQLELQAGA
jgi:protein gp37